MLKEPWQETHDKMFNDYLLNWLWTREFAKKGMNKQNELESWICFKFFMETFTRGLVYKKWVKREIIAPLTHLAFGEPSFFFQFSGLDCLSKKEFLEYQNWFIGLLEANNFKKEDSKKLADDIFHFDFRATYNFLMEYLDERL
jgi:hypothetical protein